MNTAIQTYNPEALALAEQWREQRQLKHELIRQKVLEEDRLDVLCKLVFGNPALTIKPFHARMIRFQRMHDENLILVYRDAGKTQILTIGTIVHELLKNPDIRILIASKTCGQAETFLRGVKKRLIEPNLVEIFGKQVSDDKWDTREINVLRRTSAAMESNVTTVGIDGAVVSKHFDMIICDDLVTLDNSRTQAQREKTQQWFYTELLPTLEEGGRMSIIGTRYHWGDLYGHLIRNEYKDKHLVIPALDKHNRSPWPERHSPAYFEDKRKKSGTIIFNCQYQCDTDAMQGTIFKAEYLRYYDQAPHGLAIYQGVDVAIGEKQRNDFFALVTIGVDPVTRQIYVLDCVKRHLTFPEQVKMISGKFEKFDPIRVGVESNAYQRAVVQEIRANTAYKHIRAFPIFTTVDKETRAHKLAARFENGEVVFAKDMAELEDELLSFPHGDHDDLFDALDIAVTMATRRKLIKRRETEPGVM